MLNYILIVFYLHYNNSKIIGDSDLQTTNRYIKLPICLDMHVHVREPGGEQKETWDTCSRAAIRGGNGLICAMPNTNPSCTNIDVYNMVDNLARNKSVCDYMIFMGADGDNYRDLEKMNPKVCAIKFYLNETFSNLKINNISVLRQYFIHCPDDMLMCFHAEVEMVGVVLYLASIYKKRVHICHISRKEEVEMIRDAKQNGIEVTCEVTPHHLFIDDELVKHLPESFRTVKPILNTDEDKKALWDNMDMIDCFATDHAPHLKEEKQTCGCPGFTGLETALPLLLDAVNKGRLTIEDIANKYYHNPKRILRLDENYGKDSYIEVNLDREFTIRDEDLITKAGWTPFNGLKVKGCLERVVLNNECVYNNGLVENLKLGRNANIYKLSTIKDNNVNSINNFNQINELTINSDNELTTDMTTEMLDESPSIYNLDDYTNGNLTTTNSNKSQNNTIKVVNIGDNVLFDDIYDLHKFNNVINVSQFTRDNLRSLFKNAGIIKNNVKKSGKLDILKGKTVGLYFDEPSSRTYGSFYVAVKKLGGDVLPLNSNSSSTKKGETLYDTLKCIESYCDFNCN